MTTYRKCWALMGHSNAEGIAGSSPMYAAAPHLQPWGGAPQASTAADAAKRTHKNLKMFVTAIPWAGAYAGQTTARVATTINTGSWLDITLDAAASPGSVHPYASPYQFPSGRTAPVTPDLYRADVAGLFGYLPAAGGGGFCGVELPLAHGLSQIWGESSYGVKLAIPATFILRHDQGNSFPWYAWWSPDSNFDFEPTTGRLFQSMLTKMGGAAAALPAGEKLDVQVSVFWFGDNDSTYADAYGESRLTHFKETYKAAIKKWREALVENEWTQLPIEQCPVVMMGVYGTYGSVATQATIATALQEIEDEDPYVRYVATTGYESLSTAGFGDTSHLSHNGYLSAADDIIEAYQEMQTAPLDAMDTADLVTVSELRDRIRVVYENNRSRTGASSDDTLLQHINASLTHIHNKMGDQAYWLRKRVSMTLSSEVGAVETMPKNVHRVLRIEDEHDITKTLRFQMVGHADGGKLQIVMQDRGAGTFVVHYIEQPKELTVSDQIVPLPRVALEWLVNETCRRLARTTGNLALSQQLQVDAAQCQVDVQKHASTMQRAKNDRLYGQRSLRGRIGSYRSIRPWQV